MDEEQLKNMKEKIKELFVMHELLSNIVQEIEVEVESASDSAEIRICELEDTVLTLKTRITQLEKEKI